VVKTEIARHLPSYDGNGNIIAWTTDSGQETTTRDFDAFGNIVTNQGSRWSYSTPFGFSTKYEDIETGLLYYGYRYYDPVTGRWPSRDPIEERGGVNLYGIVGNNNINYLDYLGLDALFAFDGTWLDFSHQSNVALLYNHYQSKRKLYLAGVGTGRFDSLTGGGFGAGGKRRVRKAVCKMVEYYNEGERTFDVIGFSRGAALARDFTNEATKYFRRYNVDVEFRFMGLFDTVAAFGWPGNDINIGFNLNVGANVRNAAQVISRDDSRAGTFRPQSLPRPRKGQNFHQKIMPGDHSDIGGGWPLPGGEGHEKPGYPRTLLSKDALKYIWRKGRNVGVPWSFPQKVFDYGDGEWKDIEYENSRRSHSDESPGFNPIHKKLPYTLPGQHKKRDLSDIWEN
jgi:RHS repeat-associated protein